MALKSLSALATAIAAVKKEAGDFAEYKPLLDALTGVSKELGGADAAGDAKDGTADNQDPFAAAEQKHKEITAAKIDAAKAADKPTPGDEADKVPAAAPADGAAK